jgi:acyl-CoA synthetase (NDP forming)
MSQSPEVCSKSPIGERWHKSPSLTKRLTQKFAHCIPMLLFGLGGVTTELIKDFSLRVYPVDRADIREMIREIKCYPLLEGFRGRNPADLNALEDAMMNLSHLAMAWKDRLSELDINPLVVLPRGNGVRVVDALIINK